MTKLRWIIGFVALVLLGSALIGHSVQAQARAKRVVHWHELNSPYNPDNGAYTIPDAEFEIKSATCVAVGDKTHCFVIYTTP